MIDLLSTRDAVDSQTKACAKLLASVIAQAVHDACLPFNSYELNGVFVNEKDARKNINTTARSAIRWLFFRDSVFPLYASLIGLNADSIRRNLLQHRNTDSKILTSEQRNILRFRLAFEENDPAPFEGSDYADDPGIQPEAEGQGSKKSPGKRRPNVERKGGGTGSKAVKSLRK